MKNCLNCEAYREEEYKEYDDKGNLIIDEVGKCIRFNYLFEKLDGWLPNERICDYHRKPTLNSVQKTQPKEFAKVRHNTHFRDVIEVEE